MTHPIATWQDVVERRKMITKNLFDPLSEQELQVLDYLLGEERANLNHKHPQIVNSLIKFLEEHVS